MVVGRRRGHHLERRPGWEGRLIRHGRQRRVTRSVLGDGREPGELLDRRRRVRQPVGVVVRVGVHRFHVAGDGVERHDGAIAPRQLLLGQGLERREDGELHRVGARGRAEQLRDRVRRLRVRGQVAVVLGLDAPQPVVRGVEAGDLAEERAGGIGPLVLEGPLRRRHRVGDDRAVAGQDVAARQAQASLDVARVLRARGQLLGLSELDVGCLDQDHPEQDDHDHGQDPDPLAHLSLPER